MKKGIIKKIVSMIVAVCLMVGIANIPAYSATVISPAKTGDGYALQTEYVTPAQSVKKAVKNSAKATTKPTATKKSTAKKVTTKKVTASLVKKVANQSLTLINNMLKNCKYFSKLAKTWLNKAKKLINKTLKSKKSNATKHKWLTKAFTSVKKIRMAGGNYIEEIAKQTLVSGGVFSSLKSVLKNNTTYKIYEIYSKIINLIDNLLKNKGIIKTAKTWLNKTKNSINTYIKISFSSKEELFKKTLTSIKNIVEKQASFEVLEQESVKNNFLFSSGKNVLETSIEYKIYKTKQQSANLINTLKNNDNTSNLAKIWLKAAQAKIDEIADSNRTDEEKQKLVNEALASIQKISKNNCSTEVLEEESAKGKVFSSLQESVLEQKENIFFQCISIIDDLLKNNNLDDTVKSILNSMADLIENKINETNVEQKQWLKKALVSLENIKKENASIQILMQETSADSLFSSLHSVLETNTTYQIYNEYGDTGVSIISQLAKKLSLIKEEVFNIFKKIIGVTKEQIEKTGLLVLDLLNKGETFINCASVAVGAYLGIDVNVAAIMNLASELSIAPAKFLASSQNGFAGTNVNAEVNTLQKNGIDNATKSYLSTFEDFMEALQVGEKAILSVHCYGLGEHAITIKREENGYGVFDINTKQGREVIYTPEDFKILMTGEQGTIVNGITTDNQIYSRKVYYTAIVTRSIKEKVTYRDGGVRLTVYQYNNHDVIDVITESSEIIARKIAGTYY